MAWIESIANHLTANGLGTQGSTLFIGVMPDTTATTTLLTEYDGSLTETFSSGIALYLPSLQVRVRGGKEDYTSPHTRVLAIQTLLSAITNQTVQGTHFLRVRPTGTVIALGQDSNLRFEFTCNFEVTYD